MEYRPAPRKRKLACAIPALTLAATPALAQTNGPALELAPLVVTASGFEQSAEDAPASITVIGNQELQEKEFSSIAEALDDVEGVDVGGSVGKTGGQEIRMRGLPPEYTLILIDGRRQNTAGSVTPNGFGSTQTSFMPPANAIERIEVIRGPMSTLYGSDAMGGVINIITKKVGDAWSGSLTTEHTFNEDSDYGSRQAVSGTVSGPLVENLLGLQLRGRKFNRAESDLEYRDDQGNPLEVSKRGPSPVEAHNYNAGARLTLTPTEQHDIWLDGEVTRQKYNNDEGQLGTLDDPEGEIRGYSDMLRFEREQITLAHNSRLDLGTIESSVMHSETETKGRTIPGDNYGESFDGFPELITGAPRELTSRDLVIDSKVTTPIADHILTVGGQYWDAEMTDGLATEDFSQTTWAAFAEDEWLLRDDLALTLGARYDHHDAFGSQVSPRAYLVWNTTDSWTLKGGVSRGYRTPNLNDLHDGINGITGQGTRITIGNPDLEPETSTSTELGAAYDNQRGFRAGITLFHNDFQDKIASEGETIIGEGHPTIPEGTYDQDINVDEAITRGVELSTRILLAEDWTLSANYTYTDSEQKSGDNEGEPLTDTPEHMANASLRWRTTERLSTWLRGEYHSERYRARSRVRGAPSYADLGDFKAYTLFHLGGSYRVADNVTLNATVYNLLDKDFIDYRSYQTEDGVEYGNRYANAEEGRRYWLSANLEF